MIGVAARAAAGARTSATRQASGSRRARMGISEEEAVGAGRRRLEGAGEGGIGPGATALKRRAGLQRAAQPGAAHLDRMDGSRASISDRVTIGRPPARPYRSASVRVAAGGILRSLARRR